MWAPEPKNLAPEEQMTLAHSAMQFGAWLGLVHPVLGTCVHQDARVTGGIDLGLVGGAAIGDHGGTLAPCTPERECPAFGIELSSGAKLANQFSGVVLGEIGLGRWLWHPVFAILDTLWSLPAPNPALEPRRKGVIDVELEEIVDAMEILRVLHNVTTRKIATDRGIGETQLDGLVIIPHGQAL
jgi:hypothetical protein